MTKKTTYLLTGDIGGTNSRMGLYSTGDNIPLMVKTFRNLECLREKETGIFQTNIIIPFLEECWSNIRQIEPIESSNIVASLAVAGPVRNNKVSMSNLHGIVIDGDAITNADNSPYLKAIKVCTIINDFVAQGYGCLTLTPKEVIELTPGSLKMIDPTGPKACVGAGTGLGECFLTPSSDSNGGGSYSCFPSEGGHVEWAPRTDLEGKQATCAADSSVMEFHSSSVSGCVRYRHFHVLPFDLVFPTLLFILILGLYRSDSQNVEVFEGQVRS